MGDINLKNNSSVLMYSKISGLDSQFMFGGSSMSIRYSTTRMCQNVFEIVLNITWVLNIPGFWIWQDFEYTKVTQGFKYATIWLNKSESDVNMPEYLNLQ